MPPNAKAPPLAVTMGDPAGIGPEVILKAAAALAERRGAPRLAVIGDFGVMEAAARRLDSVPAPRRWLIGDPAPALNRGLAVIEASRLGAGAPEPARPNTAGGEASFSYVTAGIRMAMRGEIGALVTAPISKEWWNRAGHRFPGHSELLARRSRASIWRMMFAGEKLRVALVTVHMGLARVPRALTRERVFQTIRLMAEHLRGNPGIAHPRIAVLGFNPHAGENGLFGDEEIRIIAPAIERARKAGIDARGPVAPDTAFIRTGGDFGFDGAVAMYHDQGLIALKTLEFDRAVNITLGLPFVRTSPDHGTAFDIAGRGVASGASMMAAIEYAARAVSAGAARTRRTA
jgi:4-hydroxythreonine-4-phosphate dehydrogenase